MKLEKSAYNRSQSRYTRTAEVRSTTELRQHRGQNIKKINIRICINYKSSDNAAGSSLYEDFLFASRVCSQSTLIYTWSLKKVPLSGGASPYRPL